MREQQDHHPTTDPTPNPQVTINNQVVAPRNSLGTAGFILALIGIFTSWVPVLGWLVWLIGAILSVVGLFHSPKGMAIAGTIISFFDVIVLVALVGTLAALF
ncbi:hypothetical protein [Lacticaseibacillus sp. GG6-2]